MNVIRPALLPLLAVLAFSGCSTMGGGEQPPASTATAKKPKPVVKASFLTYRDMQDFAEKHPEVNEQLLVIAPAMAYHPGAAKPDVVPLVADAAGLVAQELVDWIGSALAAEAKKHTAQFASFIQDPDWWTDGAPDVAAVQLTRTLGTETTFQAIVLIRPVFATKTHGIPRAFQLVPLYVLETKPAAEDFGKTMSAVCSVTVETSWMGEKGVPGNSTLGVYCFTLKEYTVGKPVLLTLKDDDDSMDPKKQKDCAVKLEDASHFFALPATPATLGVTFAVAETDPSKWVGLMEQVATAISGQAGNVNSAVKAKL